MNELIKELAEHATASISYRVCPYTFKEIDDPLGPFVRKEFSKEKFAELIVERCVEVIRPCGCGCDDSTKELQYDLMNQIKREFGVEE